MGEPVRLQKLLAEAGIASRRAAEAMILAGRVTVNGQPVQQLGTKVHPARDRIAVDGSAIKIRRKLYVAINKPRGYLCTRHDPHGRRTVFDLLPAEWGHLYTVGRLDHQSEGLLFLTNDGEFALRLTHPRYGVRKLYEVIVTGKVEPAQVRQLVEGVTEGGDRLRAERARLLSSSNSRSLIEVELSEGKNREVRRLCQACGLSVERLARTQIDRIRLGQLRTGRWRTLTEQEINSLLPPL